MSWNLLTIRESLLRQCFRQLAFAVQYVQNKLMILLYSWIFFLNTAVLYWLLRGHMTSINKAVSRQTFLRGQDRKVSKPSFINWSLSVEASRQLILLMHQYIHVAHVFNMVEPLPRTVRSATQRMESFFLYATRIQCVLYGLISFFCYTGNRGNETLCRDGKQNYI